MAEPSGHLIRGWKMPSEKTPMPTAVGNHDNSFVVEMTGARSFGEMDPNSRPRCFGNLFEEIVFVFTVMMAMASTTLIQGVVIINTGTIGRNLSLTSAEIAWIAASIGLTSGSFVLFFGKTADLFGGKVQIIFGTILLSITSLFVFLASRPMSILILCGFLGVGTAMIGPPAIGVLLATYPEGRRRNRVTGALGAGNPLGFVIGSISSGLATTYWNWRSSFMVMAIFFLVMTTFVVWTVPSTRQPSGSRKTMIKTFDYLGAVFMIIGTALVSAGLTEGPNLGWNSFKVLLMLMIGGFCIIGFGVWEAMFALAKDGTIRQKEPLLDPSVWKNRTFTLCVISVSLGYMSFGTNNFWVALYLQDIEHLAPLHVALLLMPQALAGVLWSYLGQSLISKIHGTLIMAIGGSAYLVGAILVFFIKENSSYWMFMFPAMVLSVIGADFQFIVSNLYVNKQMPNQASLAAGVLQTGRSLSIPVGLAITYAVHDSMAQTWAARSNQTYAYRYVYLCTISFAVVSLLFIPFMRIEKQGSVTPLLVSSASSSKTVLNELFEKAQTDGAQDQFITEEQKEKSHSLAQRPSNGSLSSAATAGSFDSYFPRWSWEQMKRWPDDRSRIEPDNVVYEVCIKCSRERRVLVQPEREDYDGSLNELPEVLWDVEAQNSPAEVDGYTYADETHNSSSNSTEKMVPSIVHLRRLSTNPYRKSLQWGLETQHHVKMDSSVQPVLADELQDGHNDDTYSQSSPELRYDNPVTGERVLFNGYSNQTVHSDHRRSNNPYRLSLIDTIQMPEMPASMSSTQQPMSPPSRGGRIWINRTSAETIEGQEQQNVGAWREESSFTAPPSISSTLAMAKESPRRHEVRRSVTSPLSPIKGRDFTDIELGQGDSKGSEAFEGQSKSGLLQKSPRVLNSREMAAQYSKRPVLGRERRWGSAGAPFVVNAGGWEQGGGVGGGHKRNRGRAT